MPELARAGPLAVAVAAVGIGGAILASPSFTFAGDALSDLGQAGDAAATPVTTVLFNGGLVLSGAVGLAFAASRWRGGRALDRAGALVLAVALVGMAGVGLFPAGEQLHVPAAATLYLGSMVAMGVFAVGDVAAGATRRAAATFGLVGAHVGVWWWWVAAGPVTRGGLAIPETVGAALFGAWVMWTARRRRGASA